jgi:hypothetical protein
VSQHSWSGCRTYGSPEVLHEHLRLLHLRGVHFRPHHGAEGHLRRQALIRFVLGWAAQPAALASGDTAPCATVQPTQNMLPLHLRAKLLCNAQRQGCLARPRSTCGCWHVCLGVSSPLMPWRSTCHNSLLRGLANDTCSDCNQQNSQHRPVNSRARPAIFLARIMSTTTPHASRAYAHVHIACGSGCAALG